MPPDESDRSAQHLTRLIAVVAGIAGLLLCSVVPLLPVKQTTATILWPQGTTPDGHVTGITAPLVSGAPQDLDISIPCSAIATLPPAGGLVLSTLPTEGFATGKSGLFVRANKDTIVVAFRDSVAAVAPRPAVAAGACNVLHLWANAGGTGADFVGIPGAGSTLAAEKKPQVGGIFTDLKVATQPGLSARIDVDTRFITAPTLLKKTVMAAGVLAVLTAIAALAVLDRRAGHRLPRTTRRWWQLRKATPPRAGGAARLVADALVIGTLAVWHVIGATSSDDGYNLTIARVSHQAGYLANYYRFFGTTEAPFDWYPAVLAHFASVSTAGVWMRLPATAAGIGCWLILSRFVLRRLGPGRDGLAANRVAVLTTGAVLLAAWLPFNNGLRPEPLIAFGVLLTWALVERAIAGRQLAPAAVALVVAAFTATLAPQGLIAMAALLTGARAIAQVIRRRRLTDGLLAPLAVLAASLSLITVVVFRNETLATVAESARIKYKVGPTIAWYQDFLRYYFLTVEKNAEGSMTRRFAVLVLLLCLFGVLVVLLRRARVPGLASGPAWRLIGTTAIGLLLLTFTPTKWAVQFGAFAGLAGALGAVTAFMFARIGLHSRRNLTLYVTALLFVLAWATSGINGWFDVNNYGVPWYDIPPVIASHPVTTMFLALSILTGLLAAWYHFRMDYAGHTEVKDNRRNRVLASTPLLVVATIMVLGELGSLAKGAVFRYPLYTTAKANATAIESGLSNTRCAMGDDVLTEPDPNAGLLKPADGQQFGPAGPLGGINPVGFKPDGVGDDLRSYPVVTKPGVVNSDASPNKPNATMSDSAGTAGGIKGPGGFERVARGTAVRPGPGQHPGDGQLRRELAGGHRDIGLVSTAAPYTGPADRGGLRRRCHLVLQRRRHLHLRAVAEIAVGRRSPRWHHPAACGGAADRHRAGAGVAQSAVPVDVGAPGGQRGPHRGIRPEPEFRSVVRLHPTSGAGAANTAATDRLANTGAHGYRIRSKLPLPAAVRRTPRRRRTSAIPHPARTQTDGGVVERVGSPRRRWSVPGHSGDAAHLNHLDVPSWRLVSRLGIR